MAKILISSLGTGFKKDGSYNSAKYEIDSKVYETSFIAQALDKHLQLDSIFLIGTKKSIWDEVYSVFGGEDEIIYEKLYEEKESGEIDIDSLKNIEKLTDGKIKPFLIDYGIDEDEIWSNFEKFLEVANLIEDGDEVYLDITHSFRSLSLMSFVMTQFASSISEKKFTIKAVYYGMYEYSFEHKDDLSPIVDLKILLELQEWIKAIDAIKKYGDFNALVELLRQANGLEKDVKNSFIQLNNSFKMANIAVLEQFIKMASKKINSIDNSKNKIVKLLAPQIISIVKELDYEKKSDFQFALAKWFYRNHNYALSYMALYEAIISKSCENSNYDINDHKQREDAKKSIGNDKYGKFFYTKYDSSISVIRNSIAHQNNDREKYLLQDIGNLGEFIKTFENYFKK